MTNKTSQIQAFAGGRGPRGKTVTVLSSTGLNGDLDPWSRGRGESAEATAAAIAAALEQAKQLPHWNLNNDTLKAWASAVALLQKASSCQNGPEE